MLSLLSYHTAIVQTGAAMFSFAAPVGGYAIVPMVEAPAAPPVAKSRPSAVNDNIVGRSATADLSATSGVIGRTQYLDHAHNEALFNALMSSSSEVSGPIYLD